MTYIIYKDGEQVNRIVADAEYMERYYSKGGYTYEEEHLPEPEPITPEPTQEDRFQAQLLYTALMTDTLLEV